MFMSWENFPGFKSVHVFEKGFMNYKYEPAFQFFFMNLKNVWISENAHKFEKCSGFDFFHEFEKCSDFKQCSQIWIFPPSFKNIPKL